jgi:hypothetical protein
MSRYLLQLHLVEMVEVMEILEELRVEVDGEPLYYLPLRQEH